MDKIRALRYFVKVAETSSFTTAANLLSVPASSISRRIRDLESELQVELFHRSTRIVKLSELGEIYYEQVKNILADLDNADDFISQTSQVPSGLLRISVMPGFATIALQPVLDKINKLFPEIVLDIELTNRVSDITQNEVDIAIRGTSVLPERAVAKKLCDNNFILVAAPHYLEQNGTPTSIEELLIHRTLLYRGPNGILHWQMLQNDTWKELKTTPTFISNDGLSLVRTATKGHGIALLPKWGVSKELANNNLIEITIPETHISVSRSINSSIYLLYLRPRYRILKIRAVVDLLIAELTEEKDSPQHFIQ